ncbi:unnamed protein product [Rotaria sp. Silwood1]|nr:unnamed protein product [Rotaria sp. Silwood1]CAF3450840.1 unnamed protein product [Rotaria sp. Silwood1]CAF3451757.1 unnamed protein product [Rotaria sp. Silwood1]CAF4572672.1 unnamed protein product [Rotaria sp. Silwood1]CAF4872335.1 unnamed protein product [Rotaria sp. Silwood1]
MEDLNIEQLISRLITAPSNNILREMSYCLIEAQESDFDTLIATLFHPLFTLETWAWEVLSRDSRQWNNDEQECFDLFHNISNFNKKIILSNNDVHTKGSLLLPANTDIIDGVFEQFKKRNDENERFLTIIYLWFDNLSLLMREHIEFASASIIIYINERITSDIIMTDQFKIYLNELQDPCPLFTMKQVFYIKTCSFLLGEYLCSKPHDFPHNGQEILEYLADDYTNIILIHSKTILSWSKDLLSCITHLIGLITACHLWIGTKEEILKMFMISDKTIYDYIESLIDILHHQTCHERNRPQLLNDESILVDNIFELFNYFINFQNIINFFRSQKNLVDILLKYDVINNDRFYLRIYRLQSKILSEKQIKKSNIVNKINKIFFYYLDQAWKSPLKKYNTIPIEELLEGLLTLSQYDTMKNPIADSNELQFLIEKSDEYPIIYDILWSLSFDIRIQAELRLNQTLKNKLESNYTNEQIQNIIYGIQWNLNPNNMQINTDTNKAKYDVMISYSHEDKSICTQLYHELIQKDFKVLIDLNDKHHNIMDAMVQAVKQSFTIIVCISKHYKQSNYCRAEAQYAFGRQLKIIPILIDNSYKPDGWLSYLIRGLSLIDFTKYEFSHGMQILLDKLKIPPISVLSTLVVRQPLQNVTNVSLSTLDSTDMCQWTPNDVQQWLIQNNLSQMKDCLSGLNGSYLIRLSKDIAKNSPQENLNLFQEHSMKKTGKDISLTDISRLQTLIEEHIQKPTTTKQWSPKLCCRMM